MAERYVRVSPGVYRDTQTGKTINSATKPVAPKVVAKPAAPVAAPVAAPAPVAPPQSEVVGAPVPEPVIDPLKAVKLTSAKNVLQNQNEYNEQIAEKQNVLNNPNQENFWGGQTTTIDPVTGQPTVKQSMSAPQQQIAQQQDDLSIVGRQLAQQQLGGLGTFNDQLNAEQFGANRQKAEDASYANLTKGLQPQYTQERETLDQTLANRGIPLDPQNEAYQRAVKQLDDRYDTLRGDARNQSVQLGSQQYQQDFGNALTQYNTNLGSIGQLQSMGGGLVQQNWQGYSPTQLQGVNIAETALGYQQLAAQKKAADQSYQLAMRKLSAGGGAPAPESPFVQQLYPGATGGGGNDPSAWSTIGAAAAQGFGRGAGQGVANWF